jgi:hypothetical protein
VRRFSLDIAYKLSLVMPGLVPGIHDLPKNERRGWPGQAHQLKLLKQS